MKYFYESRLVYKYLKTIKFLKSSLSLMCSNHGKRPCRRADRNYKYKHLNGLDLIYHLINIRANNLEIVYEIIISANHH